MDLRDIRQLKKLTQQELEAKTGVFQTRISAYENNNLLLTEKERTKIDRLLFPVQVQWKHKIMLLKGKSKTTQKIKRVRG